MRTLIQNSDLKRLATGVSLACAAGLLMGAALQPNLDGHKVDGPQILLPGGGPRTIATAADAGVAAYAGRVPDYVIGTDWTHPRPVVTETVAYTDADEGDRGDVMAYEAPPEPTAHARWVEPPREPSRYPSQDGNVPYGADIPPPPEPPADTDDAAEPA